MSIITLTTDFGTGSPYVAAMKGIILAINPAVTLVDITHEIAPQDILRAALVLDNVTRDFPDETIHVAVVDPGVGTDRAILYARIGSQHYIAPDNGVLSRLTARTPPTKLIRLMRREFWREPVSSTFHGRDIMAPVAARLSLGLDPDRLGEPVQAAVQIDLPKIAIDSQRISGAVVAIDSFGNLITNLPSSVLAGRPTDGRVCVVCNIYETYGIYGAYADRPSDTFVALVGSSGRIELAIVSGNAATRLGIQVGEPVTLAWEGEEGD